MKKIYIGPKEETIKNNDFFDYSITLFGTNENSNISYESSLTFEYWNPDNNLKEITIYNRELINSNFKGELMAHDPYLIAKCNIPSELNLICLNDLSLLETLNNKFEVRKIFKNYVPILKYYSVKGKDFKYDKFKDIGDTLVIQLPIGSGGSKTFICNNNNYYMVEKSLIENEIYSVKVNEKWGYVDKNGKKVKVIGNNTVDISKYLGIEVDKMVIKEDVHLPVLKEIVEKMEGKDEKSLQKEIKRMYLLKVQLLLKILFVDGM